MKELLNPHLMILLISIYYFLTSGMSIVESYNKAKDLRRTNKEIKEKNQQMEYQIDTLLSLNISELEKAKKIMQIIEENRDYFSGEEIDNFIEENKLEIKIIEDFSGTFNDNREKMLSIKRGGNSFMIDQYEVSVFDYIKYLHEKNVIIIESTEGNTNYPCNLPDKIGLSMNCISSGNALEFCEHYGKRLPSPEEFDYLSDKLKYPDCSSGIIANLGDQSFQKKYPGIKSIFFSFDDGYIHVAPPGSIDCDKGSIDGEFIYDIMGNLSEWTSEKSQQKPNDDYRYYWGGNFKTQLKENHKKKSDNASIAYPWIGFRCAKDLK